MPPKPAAYAIYQGDEFLDIGTIAELGEKFNVAPETIRFWATPAHLERTKKANGDVGDRKIVIKIEKDEEEPNTFKGIAISYTGDLMDDDKTPF